ncbi:HNH endonuclease [Flavobacterium sp.]|uniref:HNH endonuclease n=1 Tax=Flavobacterium sp. TaxID=239 RepID=UPI00286DE22B|nr:HNH endonuclease [Flavobacterium sp.]
MKKCIWCHREESETTFKKLAHTIPQSLGGKMICENVCDDCNHYFGNISDKLPSIEETFKETFNITRLRLLGKERVGKNKALAKFKSTYFNVDIQKGKFALKLKFQLKPNFQKVLCRQFKRGIYKVFLEELERQENKGHQSKYQFIRNFARYNQVDLPVFYFQKGVGLIMTNESWIKNPELHIHKDYRMKYLFCDENFIEFELLGHVFGIVKNENWRFFYEDYMTKSQNMKQNFIFKHMIEIDYLIDIDLALNVFND